MAMKPCVLLAKSSHTPASPAARETLIGHTRDVIEAVTAIVDVVGGIALTSMGVTRYTATDLASALGRAALLHDIGKANAQFQEMVNGKRRAHQALCHEWISVWFPLRFADFRSWLFDGMDEAIEYAVLSAVFGHHLRTAFKPRTGSGDASVYLYTDHLDFSECLAHGRATLDLSHPPSLKPIAVDLMMRPLYELRRWVLRAQAWWDHRTDTETRRFVALVKALLIAGDVAGSALPRQTASLRKWTMDVLSRTCSDTQLREVAERRVGAHALRPFQKSVAASAAPVMLVTAGCGSGKTVAAYLWASRRAIGRKLFFCYPTTGTATEGFRDYVIPAEQEHISTLLHSRSEYDLESVLETKDDPAGSTQRIESLASWDVPLILCTADTVLGMVQNVRRSLFGSPSIVSGAFVFDEIHLYDERMFGSLLHFLDAFMGTPILLMTASIQPGRLAALRRIVARRRQTLEVIAGPRDLEKIPRYRFSSPTNAIPWEQIETVLAGGGKVLWVANTVRHCCEFGLQAERHGLEPMPYHSRYRYKDRLRHHKKVIEAFKSDEPALAITTQVCEVSLDLSADMLVTELAPIPSLIQRLGRLNRRVTPEKPGTPKPVIFLTVENPLPYDRPELDVAADWIAQLGAGEISQADLAAAFLELSPNDDRDYQMRSAWLDGGPLSDVAPLRDAGSTIPVIRAEDLAACIDQKKRPIIKGVTANMIPMTLRGKAAGEVYCWERVAYAFVAPEGRIDYDEKWGATWSEE